MVFVKDTPPEQLVRTLAKGKRIHVLGMPRIDLALVSWRTRNAAARPEVLTWRLPYEIIVVCVYKVVEDEEQGESPAHGDRRASRRVCGEDGAMGYQRAAGTPVR